MSDQLEISYRYNPDYPSYVDYPDTGFIYLYPRICDSELVLLGMITYFVDPDNTGPGEPIYQPVE